jgi:hypothetical protein
MSDVTKQADALIETEKAGESVKAAPRAEKAKEAARSRYAAWANENADLIKIQGGK